MYVDSKLIGILLVSTCFKKKHCKYRVFTKGLSYILRNCYCNRHVTKAISQLHEEWDLWCVCVCVCSVCPPLTCTLYQNVPKCSPWTSTTRRLCTRKFYVAHLDTSIDLSVFLMRFSVFHFSIHDSSITIDVYVICIEADKCDHCHDYSVLENHYFVSYIF